MRATTIYNSISINKATNIPNRLNINSTDTNKNNNNNINGIANDIQNEENSISVTSIDNTINIYDDNTISGVDNITEIGENNNLVNNSTDSTNINDNNNNISGNTPGEENITAESVDSYPLNLRTEITNCTENEAIPSTDTDIPILRLRGGLGEEEKEEQTVEETVGERFILTTLDEEESEAIGGRMEDPKLPGMIRISGCNPNGIKAHQLKSHLQHSMDLKVDIQCVKW
jgi:hypothetical protein